jgi:hypothetical protein
VRSTLFRVVWTSGWRKVRPALAANPLLAVLGLAAAAAAPGTAAWAGARLSTPFAEATAQPGFLRALALGAGVTAVVAGISVALLAPGPSALGPQLAAVPRSRATLATGTVIAPVCAAGAVLALLLACFAVPLAGGTGVALVLLAASCASLGAALGEGARLMTAGQAEGLAALAAAGGAWTAAGLAGGGGAYLGPAGAVGPWWGVAALAALTVAGIALWTAASGVPRRERASTRDARVRWLPARAGPAVALATARRVLRHPELRLHGVTAVVLPVAAAIAARLTFGVGGASATVFCIAVTLTAAALYPPAALGLARGAGWLLDAAPRRRSAVAAATVTGGVAAAAGLLVATAILAVPLGRPEASIYLELEGASAFVLGCAALAGALVPWHPERVLNQLASYAAVLAIVVAAWLVVGRLEHLAPGETAFGLVAGNAVLMLGIGSAAVVSR